jgi:hypothetical protein
MNKPTHILIGKYLYGVMKDQYGIVLDRTGFLFGNVLPDLRPSFLTRPHFPEYNISYVKKEIRNLLSKKQKSAYFGRTYSRRLGVICHYYADFFCFAHNRYFTGDIVSHVKYEKDFHRFLLERYPALNVGKVYPRRQAAGH